jgi:hypothetical protein
MSVQQTEKAIFDKQAYHEHLTRLWAPMIKKFDRLVMAYVFFNLLFLTIAVLEVCLFFSFDFIFNQRSLSNLRHFVIAI